MEIFGLSSKIIQVLLMMVKKERHYIQLRSNIVNYFNFYYASNTRGVGAADAAGCKNTEEE
jgi:hypothetical protein